MASANAGGRGLGLRAAMRCFSISSALSLVCFLGAFFPPSTGLCAQSAGPPVLQVIASAGAVHSMDPTEALRHHPVRFRGIVTFCDVASDSLFVGDATGGVYVSVPDWTALHVQHGSQVEVTGVTWPGDFAPIVFDGHLRTLGRLRQPMPAPRVTVTELSAGLYDSRWVEVEGSLRTVARAGLMVLLTVATRDGPIVAVTPAMPGQNYERLIDAQVRVHGVGAVDFNKHRQATGSHLFVPTLTDVHVLRLNRNDAFALPVRTVSRLAEFDPKTRLFDRIHLRGRVVLQWAGHLLCFEDLTGGLCVDTPSAHLYGIGTQVEVAGLPVFGAQIPSLSYALVRPSVAAPVPYPAALQVNAGDVMDGQHCGQLVSLEGTLVGTSVDANVRQFAIASERIVFNALLPAGDASPVPPGWQVGSSMRVIGVCVGEVDTRAGKDWSSYQKLASFRLMMRSPQDGTVLRKPTWWTPEHTFNTLGLGVFGMLAIFCWVLLLRRQVEQRTQELRESERRFRHLAHHDPLTGVPNRAWFTERAQRALDLSRRRGGNVGLLLLDLDHFKPVNDTLGHDAGDAMLCAFADRVTGTVRKVDTVARLGGDEFAVVLEEVSDGDDAEHVALKILDAVCRPVEIEGQQIAMSVSIGVAVFPGDGDSVTELLRSADLAMYESKKHLRGGVRRYRREIALAGLQKIATSGETPSPPTTASCSPRLPPRLALG